MAELVGYLPSAHEVPYKPGTVVHVYNASIWEMWARGPQKFKVALGYTARSAWAT